MSEDKGERWVTGRPRANNPGSISYYALSPEEVRQVVEEHNADIGRLNVHIEERSAARCEILVSEDKSTYYVLVTPEFNKSFLHKPYPEERMPENEQKDLEWWKSRLDGVKEIALDWARKYVGTDKPIEIAWDWPIYPRQPEVLEGLGLDTNNAGVEELNERKFFHREYIRVSEIPIYRNIFSLSAGPFRYNIELQNWTLDREKVKRCNEACNALVREANELNRGKGKFTSEQIREMEYQMGLIFQHEYGLLDENQHSLK